MRKRFVTALFGHTLSAPEPFGYKMGWIAVRCRDVGAVTEAEREMRFEGLAEFTWAPGEEDVMAVAAGWSFDPTSLGEASGPAGAGILGPVDGR